MDKKIKEALTGIEEEERGTKRTVCKYCGEEISNDHISPVDGFPGGWCVVDGHWLSPWCKKAPEGKEQHEPLEEMQPIPEPKQEIQGRDQSVPEEAYFDRNQSVQAFAMCCMRLGYHVGIKSDPKWSILYIDLPTGQVSWHLPNTEIVRKFPRYNGNWDGHDVQEKRDRLRKFIEETE